MVQWWTIKVIKFDNLRMRIFIKILTSDLESGTLKHSKKVSPYFPHTFLGGPNFWAFSMHVTHLKVSHISCLWINSMQFVTLLKYSCGQTKSSNLITWEPIFLSKFWLQIQNQGPWKHSEKVLPYFPTLFWLCQIFGCFQHTQKCPESAVFGSIVCHLRPPCHIYLINV